MSMSMRAIKIEPSGEVARVEITGSTISEQNDSIYEYLGGYFGTVRMGQDATMLVDDEGLLKGKPENPMAMMVSGYPMLVGTALIVGTRPGPDGDEFCDVPERFEKFADEIAAANKAMKDWFHAARASAGHNEIAAVNAAPEEKNA